MAGPESQPGAGGTATKERPTNPQSPEKLKDDPLRVVIASLDKNVDAFAREAAHEKLKKKKHEGPLWKKMVKSAWSNLRNEYEVVTETQSARADILENKNLFHHQGGDDQEARRATTMRMGSEYAEQMLHEGETFHKLHEPEAQEDPNAQRIKGDIKDFYRRFARGEYMDDESARMDLDRMFQGWHDENISQGYIGEGQILAENVLETGHSLKGMIDSSEGLDAIDKEAATEVELDKMEIILGEARVGSRAEIDSTLSERVAEKLRKVPFLNESRIAKVTSVLGNEAVIAAMMSGGIYAAKRGASMAGKIIAPGIGAGVVAALKERNMLKRERDLEARRADAGDVAGEVPDDSELGRGRKLLKKVGIGKSAEEYRAEVAATLYEARPATELIEDLSGLYNESGELNINTREDYDKAMELMGQVRARIQIGDRKDARLISFEDVSPEQMEARRFDLDLAMAKLETDMKKMTENPVAQAMLDIKPDETFEDLFVQQQNIAEGLIMGEMSEKDRLFQKLVMNRAFKRALAATFMGAAIGGAVKYGAEAAREVFHAVKETFENLKMPGQNAADMKFASFETSTDGGSLPDSDSSGHLDGDTPDQLGSKTPDQLGTPETSGTPDQLGTPGQAHAATQTPTQLGEPTAPDQLGTPATPGNLGTPQGVDVGGGHGGTDHGGAGHGASAHEGGSADTPGQLGTPETSGTPDQLGTPGHAMGESAQISENSKLHMPEGYKAEVNPDKNTITITGPDGKEYSNLDLNKDGSLSHSAIASLNQHGLNVSESHEVIHGPDKVTHTEVSAQQFVQNHRSEMKQGHVVTWEVNARPQSDLNEFGLQNHIDGNGNITADIRSMTANGSFNGNSHVNWEEAAKSGHLKLQVSASRGTQSHYFEFTFKSDGTAVIDHNSPAAAFFDKNGNFTGGYERVGLVGGTMPDGTEKVASLATEVGKHHETFRDTIKTPTLKTAHTYTVQPTAQPSAYTTGSPTGGGRIPIIPIFGTRRRMNTPAESEEPEATTPTSTPPAVAVPGSPGTQGATGGALGSTNPEGGVGSATATPAGGASGAGAEAGTPPPEASTAGAGAGPEAASTNTNGGNEQQTAPNGGAQPGAGTSTPNSGPEASTADNTGNANPNTAPNSSDPNANQNTGGPNGNTNTNPNSGGSTGPEASGGSTSPEEKKFLDDLDAETLETPTGYDFAGYSRLGMRERKQAVRFIKEAQVELGGSDKVAIITRAQELAEAAQAGATGDMAILYAESLGVLKQSAERVERDAAKGGGNEALLQDLDSETREIPAFPRLGSYDANARRLASRLFWNVREASGTVPTDANARKGWFKSVLRRAQGVAVAGQSDDALDDAQKAQFAAAQMVLNEARRWTEYF